MVAYEIFTPLALIETILGVINASTADNSTKEKVLSLLRTCRNARDKINFLIENTKLIGGIKSFTYKLVFQYVKYLLNALKNIKQKILKLSFSTQ